MGIAIAANIKASEYKVSSMQETHLSHTAFLSCRGIPKQMRIGCSYPLARIAISMPVLAPERPLFPRGSYSDVAWLR